MSTDAIVVCANPDHGRPVAAIARLSWPDGRFNLTTACKTDLPRIIRDSLDEGHPVEVWPALGGEGECSATRPLTCQYCRHAPATHLLVADLSTARATHLVCGPCGEKNLPDAAKISKPGSSAWLFALIPAAPPPPEGRERNRA